MAENEISWSAPEFVHYPKSRVWYIVFSTMALLLIVFFLFQKDFLTVVLFFLIFLVGVYFARMPGKTLNIHISGTGLTINAHRIPYQQIKNFWLVYEPPEVKTLNFETTAYLNRFITLQLQNEDPVRIRKFLVKYLPEDLERGEQLADKLQRTFKF